MHTAPTVEPTYHDGPTGSLAVPGLTELEADEAIARMRDDEARDLDLDCPPPQDEGDDLSLVNCYQALLVEPDPAVREMAGNSCADLSALIQSVVPVQCREANCYECRCPCHPVVDPDPGFAAARWRAAPCPIAGAVQRPDGRLGAGYRSRVGRVSGPGFHMPGGPGSDGMAHMIRHVASKSCSTCERGRN